MKRRDAPAAQRCPAARVHLIALQGCQQWHSETQFKKNFPGQVLGYVTPWNRDGHQMAVDFRAKFTWISPVWYTLKTDPQKALALVGGVGVGHRLAARMAPSPHVPSCAASDHCILGARPDVAPVLQGTSAT